MKAFIIKWLCIKTILSALCYFCLTSVFASGSITYKPAFSQPAMATELRIDSVIVGDCEFGARTGNKSKVLVAVFISWKEPDPGSKIVVKLNGQSIHFDPFIKACPPYVQFILDPDGGSYLVEANFNLLSTVVAIPVRIDLPLPCDPPICSGTSSIGGKIYNDFNNNGSQDLSETGVPNIDIYIYDDSKLLIAQTKSKTNGVWAANGLTAGTKVRVEFQIPSGKFDSNIGTENKTRTQKTVVGDCNVHLGLFNLESVVEENPWIVTAIFTKGKSSDSTSPASTNPSIISNQFNTSSGGPRLGPNGSYYFASARETGSIWGLGFQENTKQLFSSAFLKRNAELGPAGLGAIYQTNLSNILPSPVSNSNFQYYGNTKLFLNLDDFGIQTGNESTLIRDISFNPNDASRDSTCFPLVGKWGLGDLDLNKRGDSLFVVNMYNRSLIIIEIGNPVQLPIAANRITEIPIPAPNCFNNSDWRPWALKYHEGSLYIGGVCSAESTLKSDDLKAIVYKFDNGNFSEIINIELNYTKGFLEGNICSNFKHWSNDYYYYQVRGDVSCAPVPVLSDIEFDSEGNLILGLGDRFGYQTGGRDFGTRRNDNIVYIHFAGGDLLKLFKHKHTYLLEKNATAGFYTTSGSNNNQGVCGGEFFFQDGFFSHQESALGGLAIHPSYNTILSTMMDPANIWSNGWSQLDNSIGSKNVNYNLFTGERGTFGKSAGLGDIEILIGSSTPKGIGISVGNYIWDDKDSDGLQDPGEDVLNGLNVRLYDQSGTLVSSTTTNNEGQYYFNDLSSFSLYYVQIGDDIDYVNGKLILNNKIYFPTVLRNKNNSGNIENDSDAELYKNMPSRFTDKIVFPYTSGKGGENDFSLDFGLRRCTKTIIDTFEYKLCLNDSIEIEKVWYSSTNPYGEHKYPGLGENGCDSTAIIIIQSLPLSSYQLDSTICKGGTLRIHNILFDENHTQDSVTLFSASSTGCDSTIRISIKFNNHSSSTLDTVVCPDEEVRLHSVVLNANNPTASIVLSNANQYGCDSVIQARILFKTKSYHTIDTTICRGSFVRILNRTFDEKNPTGTIILNGANYVGCDSLIDVRLQFNNHTNGKYDTTVCRNHSVVIHNQTFDLNNPSGIIQLSKANQYGCDSTVQFTLHFHPNKQSRIDTAICPGSTITINGHIFDEKKLREEIFYPSSSQHGCDSSLVVSVKVLPQYKYVDSVEACDEYYWDLNRQSYKESGVFDILRTTKDGCDSTYKLILKIYPSYTFRDTVCTINKYHWVFGKKNFDTSGVFTARLETHEGCDSIRILYLEILSEGEVYVPNVFSPNGDGINDKTTVYSNPDVHLIDMFRIYDRWGELMYENKSFPPNDPRIGWDGVFLYELCQPAVFTYYVEWRDKLGGPHRAVGDITLVR
ncbi:MAG: hypothetical protein HOP11_07680 [Saprospiraceae bacterium]|nr:hypothetical protein [Saprospiraceae bacterium]